MSAERALAVIPGTVAEYAPPSQALVPANLLEAMKLADLMARASLVPSHLQQKPADCLLVIEQAQRWGLSPFAVAQCTSVISGKLMFEGKLVAAVVNSRAGLAQRLQFAYTGEGNDRRVTVSGTFPGESEARTVDVCIRDAKTNNSMWTKQPDQQLAYHGARVWARRHAPELMLGVNSPEEMEPQMLPAPRAAIGPKAQAPAPASASEAASSAPSAAGSPAQPATDAGAPEAGAAAPDIRADLRNEMRKTHGWPVKRCTSWLKKYFGVNATGELTDAQVADARLLLTERAASDEDYRRMLEQFASEGRIIAHEREPGEEG